MKKYIILPLLILISALGSAVAKPRLVVNITVAGMRYDYLLKFQKGWSEGGFRRLMSEGAECQRALIDYVNTTTPVGVATIATGASPSGHGVVGSHWFDYTTGTRVQLCHDTQAVTVGDDELDAQISPRNLVASTIGDCIGEVEPASKVISVAVDPLTAVISGGFTADGVYWVSPRSGNFVTSSYYTQALADWVNTFNNQGLAAAYSSTTWMLSRPSQEYYNVFRSDVLEEAPLLDLTPREFNMERLLTRPGGNTLVKDFAVQCIIAENLGGDDATDYLNVVFEVPYIAASKYGSNSMEVEDIMYRLDNEISTFVSFLESHLGRENVLLVFAGAHGTSDPVIESSKLPAGRFNASQFEILINGFLSAQLSSRMTEEQLQKISADTPWVLDFVNNQLYLNRGKIYQAGFSLTDIQNLVTSFAIQFRGVASTITSITMQSGEFSTGVMGMAQRNYFARHSGDVVVNLLPGWIESDDKLSMSGSPYIYDTHVPLVFWGAGIVPQDIIRDVRLQDIAPTVAQIVGVTPPNAATGSPIAEILQAL